MPGRWAFSELRHVSHVRSKAAAKRERPWYRPCRTCLTEYRILVMHDAASPGIRRASGRKRGGDNRGVTQGMRGDLLGLQRGAGLRRGGGVPGDQVLDGVAG